ncbi:BrnT family toxin [Roseobacter sp. HKCCD9010]|uniref:BrnT family toxin n=1 Tax=unclassified Roseobacter TaxID=196798 RepID=UPI0014918588|nr:MULTISPECIES: BrnT family toxin [unclassified Roseobacter]MBF9051905.1 BrnT family toxin [Rhodobacterales bacterium HKCCD4356]NNV13898.1 BrnT family toxin [Roseobacter sp. HKCCD7357]NNV18070.1 BrnT family toxin [Roseobacter sp. HKCCD8768]NNV27530.1 BrnT family toxin [Roseobacter sp. HKCCD8192]NNV31796.1 BrnT family toxin [Roseobacter sp. HKCCD9061]
MESVRIEFDEAKRVATLNERGLDFLDVAHLDWTTALTAQDARKTYGELRFVTIGLINARLCVVAWTQRESALRVISLRKANKREIARYDTFWTPKASD